MTANGTASEHTAVTSLDAGWERERWKKFRKIKWYFVHNVHSHPVRCHMPSLCIYTCTRIYNEHIKFWVQFSLSLSAFLLPGHRKQSLRSDHFKLHSKQRLKNCPMQKAPAMKKAWHKIAIMQQQQQRGWKHGMYIKCQMKKQPSQQNDDILRI